MIQNSQNPDALVKELAQTNSQVKEAYDLVKQYGDSQTAFYAICKQRGVDPQSILSQLK